MYDGIARESAPYLFLGQTTSLCETCLGLVPAKIIEQDGGIYYSKRCPEHGVMKTLVSDDPVYWRRTLEYLKPGDRPLQPHTRTERGCPWDCGLCPDHEQHSCLAIVEINEACNLACPVCFADSSPKRNTHRSLAEVERMFDALVASEGEPDLVQISGGEPTIHPQILEVIAAARRRPIKHVMLNTNGIRIAEDPAFVDALAEFKPGFEVYLQFDSLNDEALKNIRGAALSRIRRQALANLEARNISTTLVCTVKRGVNDDEIGAIVRHALTYKCVRGVNFQPVQDAGRNEGFDPKTNRIVLSEIRRRIVEDSGIFADGDMIPLPCNPASISIGYGVRNGATVIPLTSLVPREALLPALPGVLGAVATSAAVLPWALATSARDLPTSSVRSCCGVMPMAVAAAFRSTPPPRGLPLPNPPGKPLPPAGKPASVRASPIAVSSLAVVMPRRLANASTNF